MTAPAPASASLSIVIPWANRDELGRTLRANGALARAHGFELVVVDCGGDAGRCEAALVAAEVPVTLVEVPCDGFNKALALNLGAHAAAGEALMFLDADVILDDGWLSDALAAVADGAFVTVARVRESQPEADPVGGQGLRALAHLVEFETESGAIVRVETNRREFGDHSRGGPGLIVLRRADFLAVDGMNSDLLGWGWEDVDLVARLQLSGVARRVSLGSALHLSHGDELRAVDAGDRHRSERSNFGVCLANYRLGHLRGTFTDDMQSCLEFIDVRRWTPDQARGSERREAGHA
jgi:glycosyltransferase involved in cell wall biosynthesis